MQETSFNASGSYHHIYQYGPTTSSLSQSYNGPTFVHFPSSTSQHTTNASITHSNPSHQHQAPTRGNPNSIGLFILRLPPSLQQPMREVLSSAWWMNNTIEPDQDLRQFIYPESRTRFHCLIRGCGHIFNREDRAITHIRAEIDHRPFACNKECGDPTCTLAFLSNRDLVSHKRKPITTCSKCLCEVTARNLTRHMRSQRCLKMARRLTADHALFR
ncbi:hypothetical protein CPB86DRAFT_175529 [Serendipita vermifera]|nr:hypothetical protein CPB86DRAFT_175529 [Serendipita vermifera]